MTSWAVCDSGILIATVLEEPLTVKADLLLSYLDGRDIGLAAPVLLRYEIIAAMRKSVYRGILTQDDAIRSREVLLARTIRVMISDNLLRRALTFASELNLPTAYDSQYLAVAEHLRCDFWTADQRLFNVVSDKLPWVQWLGDFEPPQAERDDQ
ncbi:MAG: type II toxin-antitoxin system VapC family toxin [Chloroflexi bacterium]|nr:type II toxin-antitoxin system VapC family toxin [Chloroflexota bacterium]